MSIFKTVDNINIVELGLGDVHIGVCELKDSKSLCLSFSQAEDCKEIGAAVKYTIEEDNSINLEKNNIKTLIPIKSLSSALVLLNQLNSLIQELHIRQSASYKQYILHTTLKEVVNNQNIKGE